ncbi:MAG: OmpA family protein [Gammaproteobacteria bacterium]
MKRIAYTLAGLACVALVSCATQHPAPPPVKPHSSTSQTLPNSATALPAAQVLTPREQQKAALKAWMARHPGLAGRSVYFDFNRSRVHGRYEQLLKAQAEYLFAHANAIVRLEGNCDERGTVGYNLALGQKRAHAVADLLEALGTNPKQIEIVSYGKQRPVAHENTQADWAVNRRVDIVYVSGPPKGCLPNLPGRDRSQPSSWKERQMRRLKARACSGATF